MIYFVKSGRMPGIYANLKDALEQVISFSDGKIIRFDTIDDTVSALEDIDYRYVLLQPKASGVYKSLDKAYLATKKFGFNVIYIFEDKRAARMYFNEHVAEVRKPKAKNDTRWYAMWNDTASFVIEGTQKMKEFTASHNFFNCKKFAKKRDASRFLDALKKSELSERLELECLEDSPDEFHPYAFVDGSYNHKTSTCGYGCICRFDPDKKPEILTGSFEENELRNVAGELAGATAAIKRAVELGCRELVIFHDFDGVCEFANSKTNHRNQTISAYQNLVRSVSGDISLTFSKVKAHSSIKGNNIADRLAKAAADIKHSSI